MSGSVRKLRRLRPGNAALSEPLDQAETARMVALATMKIRELFDILWIDSKNDHNTRNTPERVAKMLVCELLEGRYSDPPRITEFDNAEAYDDLIVTGPIALRSTCAHHMLPIFGHVFIGAIPSANGRIIGLSKYDRIVAHFASRLQIQEELVRQIGSYIDQVTQPSGLAVRISAVHMCKTQRGVRASNRSRMVSTAYYGTMLREGDLKKRFLQECFALERVAEF